MDDLAIYFLTSSTATIVTIATVPSVSSLCVKGRVPNQSLS